LFIFDWMTTEYILFALKIDFWIYNWVSMEFLFSFQLKATQRVVWIINDWECQISSFLANNLNLLRVLFHTHLYEASIVQCRKYFCPLKNYLDRRAFGVSHKRHVCQRMEFQSLNVNFRTCFSSLSQIPFFLDCQAVSNLDAIIDKGLECVWT